MSSSKTLICPAKINLGLSVPCRRPDGYHEIESLFLPIDFHDELTVSHSQETAFRTENLIELSTRLDFEAVSERGQPEKNLIFKVLAAVNASRDQPLRLDLFLRKRIPSGAGLGGGSSNAGTLLRWMVEEQLIPSDVAFAIAKSRGADIPFFLNPLPSSVRGIGDLIEPIDNSAFMAGLRDFRGILVLSDIVVPTKNAYAELKRPLQPAFSPDSGRSPGMALQALLVGDVEALSNVRNDFEEVIFRLHPELERVKMALQQCGALYSSMTGSGSALYGLFRTGTGLVEGIASLEEQFSDFRFVPFGFFL